MEQIHIVVLGDTHGGHKLGLLSPHTELINTDTGETIRPVLDEQQSQLWQWYCEDKEAVLSHVGRRDKIILVHNGDITTGTKHSDTPRVSSRMSDDIQIGVANLSEFVGLKEVVAVYLTCGTGSHEFGLGSSTVAVANALRLAHPQKDVRAAYHIQFSVMGYLFDISHHGPTPGSRTWLRGNDLRLYLRDIYLSNRLSGTQPPDMVIRSHFHRYTVEALAYDHDGLVKNLWGIITPPYCLIDDYARKASRSAPQTQIGMIMITVSEHGIKIRSFLHTRDARTMIEQEGKEQSNKEQRGKESKVKGDRVKSSKEGKTKDGKATE